MPYQSHGPWTEADRQTAIVQQLTEWLAHGHVITRKDLDELVEAFDAPVRPDDPAARAEGRS